MTIAIIVVILLILLVSFKDKIFLILFNSKKSRFIFLGSYIIKTSKMILQEQQEDYQKKSFYLSVYLNNYFLSFSNNDKNAQEYADYYKSYLCTYFDIELVDSIEHNSITKGNINEYIVSKNSGKIEYNEGGEAKYYLVLKVLEEMGKDKTTFTKNLSKLSADLVAIIQKNKPNEA